MDCRRLAERMYEDDPPDGRDPFERDRDRVLYTSALRRLAETTQVFPPQKGHVYHNRLTHTLEVAQIARRVAERLAREGEGRTPVPAACEAAAWAHDLGHPPFGHTGEAALDAALRDRFPHSEGYEGNAQSFRIVTRLAVRTEGTPGLNLTRATLGGILKYPWHRQAGLRKYGAYATEGAELAWAADKGGIPSLEAQVVDLADEVAYSVHDLFDFVRAGWIPVHRLRHPGEEFDALLAATRARLEAKGEVWPGDEALEETRRLWLGPCPLDRPFDGSRAHRGALRAYTRGLIARLVLEGVGLEGGRLVVAGRNQSTLLLLKQLTVHYVLHDPGLGPERARQAALVRRLVDKLADDDARLPIEAREQLDAGCPRDRAVADAVASLTEAEAEALDRSAP